MKGFRRAAGRRRHLLERGTQQCCRGGGRDPRASAAPAPAGKAAGAPGTGRHVGRRTPQGGRTPFSSVSYHLPWETVCGSPQVTGAREQSSDPSQLTPAALPPYSLPRSWRGDGGRMAAARGGGSGRGGRDGAGEGGSRPSAAAPAGRGARWKVGGINRTHGLRGRPL